MTVIAKDECHCIVFARYPHQRVRNRYLAGYRESVGFEASVPGRCRTLLSQPLGRLQGGFLRLETAADVQQGRRLQRFGGKRRCLEGSARFEHHHYEAAAGRKQCSCLAYRPLGGGRPIESDDYRA